MLIRCRSISQTTKPALFIGQDYEPANKLQDFYLSTYIFHHIKTPHADRDRALHLCLSHIFLLSLQSNYYLKQEKLK